MAEDAASDTELTGHGTVYDMDDHEVGAVAYQISLSGSAGGSAPVVDWSGVLTFQGEDALIEPGPHVLELDDGSRAEIEIEPAGATGGGAGQVAFTGLGVFTPTTLGTP